MLNLLREQPRAFHMIFMLELWERFGSIPGAAEEIQRIRDDLAELDHLPDGWRVGVIASFMEAFRAVWITGLGMALISLICIALMKEHTLHSTLTRE